MPAPDFYQHPPHIQALQHPPIHPAAPASSPQLTPLHPSAAILPHLTQPDPPMPPHPTTPHIHFWLKIWISVTSAHSTLHSISSHLNPTNATHWPGLLTFTEFPVSFCGCIVRSADIFAVVFRSLRAVSTALRDGEVSDASCSNVFFQTVGWSLHLSSSNQHAFIQVVRTTASGQTGVSQARQSPCLCRIVGRPPLVGVVSGLDRPGVVCLPAGWVGCAQRTLGWVVVTHTFLF